LDESALCIAEMAVEDSEKEAHHAKSMAGETDSLEAGPLSDATRVDEAASERPSSSRPSPVIAEGGGPSPVTSESLGEPVSKKIFIRQRLASPSGKLMSRSIDSPAWGSKPVLTPLALSSRNVMLRSLQGQVPYTGNSSLVSGSIKKAAAYRREVCMPDSEKGSSTGNLDEDESSTGTTDWAGLYQFRDGNLSGSESEASLQVKPTTTGPGSTGSKALDNDPDRESVVGSQSHEEIEEADNSKPATPAGVGALAKHSDAFHTELLPALSRAYSSATVESEDGVRSSATLIKKDYLFPLPPDNRSFRFRRASARRSSSGTTRSRIPSTAETLRSRSCCCLLSPDEEFDFLEKQYISMAKNYGGTLHRKMIWEWGQSINTSISILLRSSMPFRAALAQWWVSLIMILGAIACIAWHTAAAVNVASWNKGYLPHRRFRFTALELREPYSPTTACGTKVFSPGVTECVPASATDVLWPGIDSFGLLLDGCTVLSDKAMTTRSGASMTITFPEAVYMNGWYVITPTSSNPKYDAIRFKLEADAGEGRWTLVGASGWSKSSFGVRFACLHTFFFPHDKLDHRMVSETCMRVIHGLTHTCLCIPSLPPYTTRPATSALRGQEKVEHGLPCTKYKVYPYAIQFISLYPCCPDA
jgi:hypothetical protein